MNTLPLVASSCASPVGAYEFTTDWTSSQAARWPEILYPLLHGMNKPLSILEVGSHEGRSMVEWMTNVRCLDRLVCVDPWTDLNVHGRFTRNLDKARMARTLKGLASVDARGYCETSRLQLKNLCGPFDLVYIDGDHEGRAIVEDFVLVEPLLIPGSLVLFDDYQWIPHGQWENDVPPAPAIDAILQIWEQYLEVLDVDYQVLARWTGRR